MKSSTRRRVTLRDRSVGYDVVVSKAACHTRVRVGPRGVEVVQPVGVGDEEVSSFLHRNDTWVLAQLDRVSSLRGLRRPEQLHFGELMFRGAPTPVRIELVETNARGNVVSLSDGGIIVRRGAKTQTPAARGLENWLRKQARSAIATHLATMTSRIGQQPRRVYVMGQRTKWGNCSARRNLSFNWRLILAPDFVLRYLVTHEVVHLAVPDHSAKFWLTVQSLCPEAEKAKQWLSRNHAQLTVDLAHVLGTDVTLRGLACGSELLGRPVSTIETNSRTEGESSHDA